jgi:hypothetical protein
MLARRGLAFPLGAFSSLFLSVSGAQNPSQGEAVTKPVSSAKPEPDIFALNASPWVEQLKDLRDQLDDCTYKGRFSNKNAVPDECNWAYVTASSMGSNNGLLLLLRSGCSKWRPRPMSEKHRRDCEQLGLGYWHLQEAVGRAAVADAKSAARRTNTLIGDAAFQYVSDVNPGEVSEEVEMLRQLNTELEKPQINPYSAFMAGKIDAELETWMMNHCPAELAWGIPTKEYVSALTACSKLEPEVKKFEDNVLRLLRSFEPTGKR